MNIKKYCEWFVTAILAFIIFMPSVVMIYKGTTMLHIALPEIYDKLICA